MIREHEKQRLDFGELVAHIHGDLFVILELYADESGTHSPTGSEPNSEVPILAGYMGTRKEWENFDLDWKNLLKKYDVANFHAKEFKKWAVPYNTWNEFNFESFKYELAEISGRLIPVGGGYHIKEHHRRHPEDLTYPFLFTIHNFFNDLVDALEEYKISNESISIVFDIKTDRQWDSAIRDEIASFKQHGVGITGYTYGDDKDYMPLQAADLYAYRTREKQLEKLQKSVEQNVDKRVSWTTYDIILNRNLRPNRRLRPTITPELMKEMVELSGKYESVKRALNENTCIYFALKNEQRNRQ